MFGTALSLAAGLLLGLSLAAPPGPMNAVIATQAVTNGWTAGFRAGLGAMTADACFFLLALAGLVAVVEEVPGLRAAMVGVGGLLMLYFAYGAARSAREGLDDADDSAGFTRAFLLAITNPYQITWWLTAGLALLDPTHVSAFGLTLGATDGYATVLGFFLGILVWITGFPAALRVAGDRVRRFDAVVAYASAVVLVVFGLVFLRNAVLAVA